MDANAEWASASARCMAFAILNLTEAVAAAIELHFNHKAH